MWPWNKIKVNKNGKNGWKSISNAASYITKSEKILHVLLQAVWIDTITLITWDS